MATMLYYRFSSGGGAFEAYLDYDETDYQETNDDGDPDNFRITRVHGTNDVGKTATLTLFRKNGGVWRTAVIPDGTSFSENTGGPVRYESDLPRWTLEFD